MDTWDLEKGDRVTPDSYRVKSHGVLFVTLWWGLEYACAFIRNASDVGSFYLVLTAKEKACENTRRVISYPSQGRVLCCPSSIRFQRMFRGVYEASVAMVVHRR
ncbi:hypothetical protein EVAR_39018_1 [Eumeta japonica]|uniref:Uncharacterized protein n=1 Tax=Eumeta variegata TaxID=151549 RepID=A0A4C1WRV5_EUMVA|nr:hypothetical protein EVAR_39018_1 [Eumeta japonica]